MDRNRENTTHTAAWTETERIQHTQQHRQKQRECNTHALEYSSIDRNRENTTHTGVRIIIIIIIMSVFLERFSM